MQGSNVELMQSPGIAPLRPKLLRPIAIVLAILTIADVLQLWPGSEDFAGELGITVVLIPAILVVLWFLDKGRNWARLVMLWQCVFSLIVPLMWDELRTAERILNVIWGFADAFLLVWLNLRPVKLFFASQSKPNAAPPTNRPPIPEP